MNGTFAFVFSSLLISSFFSETVLLLNMSPGIVCIRH